MMKYDLRDGHCRIDLVQFIVFEDPVEYMTNDRVYDAAALSPM